mgnify:FL=1|tara:strand:+ start:2098 stop:2337 length:240 start_codon:yes stop_codon:yes gene_type:complete
MQRVIKKITTLSALLLIVGCASTNVNLNTQPTLCDELTEGLNYEEILAKLTDEQLVECGFVDESACWLSDQRGIEEGEE